VLKLWLHVSILQVSDGERRAKSKSSSSDHCITLGFPEYGEELLAKFKWGHAFKKVNGYDIKVIFISHAVHILNLSHRQLLSKYAKCQDSTEVVKVQNEWLEQIANEHKLAREVDEGRCQL
jgi:hypothetical protein